MSSLSIAAFYILVLSQVSCYIHTKYISVKSFQLRYNSKSAGDIIQDKKSLDLITSFEEKSKLNEIFDNIPLEEKYSLLLESYSREISKTDDVKKSEQLYTMMEALYSELLQLGSKSTSKSSTAFINAASLLCDTNVFTKAVQLVKAGGYMRRFGSLVTQLTTPNVDTPPTLPSSITIPSDSREKETFLAASLISVGALWIVTQITNNFTEETQLYSFIFGLSLILFGAVDIFFGNGESIKSATNGINRLLLKDPQREYHCESASLMIGYLVGIPSFCYQIGGVAEILTLLQENPQSLYIYKQLRPSPTAMKKFLMTMEASSTKESKYSEALAIRNLIVWKETRDENSELLALGRILVWLYAPVAAEQLRYGQTVVSDPRRVKKVLSVLSEIQKERAQEASKKTDITSKQQQQQQQPYNDFATIAPLTEETQNNLLLWAYYEATLLIRQYSDLLENLKDYLNVGTSNVGECIELIEQELS